MRQTERSKNLWISERWHVFAEYIKSWPTCAINDFTISNPTTPGIPASSFLRAGRELLAKQEILQAAVACQQAGIDTIYKLADIADIVDISKKQQNPKISEIQENENLQTQPKSQTRQLRTSHDDKSKLTDTQNLPPPLTHCLRDNHFL